MLMLQSEPLYMSVYLLKLQINIIFVMSYELMIAYRLILTVFPHLITQCAKPHTNSHQTDMRFCMRRRVLFG